MSKQSERANFNMLIEMGESLKETIKRVPAKSPVHDLAKAMGGTVIGQSDTVLTIDTEKYQTWRLLCLDALSKTFGNDSLYFNEFKDMFDDREHITGYKLSKKIGLLKAFNRIVLETKTGQEPEPNLPGVAQKVIAFKYFEKSSGLNFINNPNFVKLLYLVLGGKPPDDYTKSYYKQILNDPKKHLRKPEYIDGLIEQLNRYDLNDVAALIERDFKGGDPDTH